MDNDDNKVVKNSEPDPGNGRRKVILGEEDFRGTDREAVEPRGAARPADKKPGFFDRFLNREEEPDHDKEPLTREAQALIRERERNRGQQALFDEDKDRLVAEESTKAIPTELLESRIETGNPAARLVAEADASALAAEGEPMTRRERGPVSDRERRDQRVKNRWITGLVLAAIAALLILFAPQLQELVFKTTDDSLIFSPAVGLFGPRAGIILILLGLLGLGIVFSTLFTKRKEETLSRKQASAKRPNPFRTVGLVMLILIPLGFAALFNFTEFRNTDIRYSSLFNQNKVVAYDKVSSQDIDVNGEDIFYTIKTPDAPDARFNITKLPLEAVKLLDNKLPKSRNVRITSEATTKLVEKNIYTNAEIIRLFINKQ